MIKPLNYRNLVVLLLAFIVLTPSLSGSMVTGIRVQGESIVTESGDPTDSIVIMLISKDTQYDSSVIDTLRHEGYKVVTTYPNPLAGDQIMIDSLNNADLVIIGRSSVSSDLASSKLAWNSLTVPLLLMSQHSSASNKLNWLNTIQVPHVTTADTIKGYTTHRSDTIFYGITFSSGDTLDWAIAPEDLVILSEPTNGTVLMKTDYTVNAVLVVRFEPGQPFYASICDKPYGPRTFFGTGLNTNGILHPFPLTHEAKKIWLAEIRRLVTTAYTPYIPSTDASLSDLTIGLGELDPVFQKNVTTYNAVLPEGTTLVRIIATPAFPCAAVTGDGEIDVSSGSADAEVVVTAENGTTSQSYFIHFTVTPTNIRKIHEEGLALYPNPANSAFRIRLGPEYLGAELKIQNVLGEVKVCRRIKNEEEMIDIHDLVPGVYAVTVKTTRSLQSAWLLVCPGL
jgi:hypothetical protein